MSSRIFAAVLALVMLASVPLTGQESKSRLKPSASAKANAVESAERIAEGLAESEPGAEMSAEFLAEGETIVEESVATPPKMQHPRNWLQGTANQCRGCDGFGCELCGHAGYAGSRGSGHPLSGFYARSELLYWWTKGLYVPALATQSPVGTPLNTAGELGQPTTSVLFGDEGIHNYGRFGGRITMGYWFNGCRGQALEGDFFYLGDATDSFSASSDGNPGLFRPYFDITDGTEHAQLVAFTDPASGQVALAGAVSVEPLTRFLGGGLRRRWNICGCETCDPCGEECFTDFTLGYRYLRLSDKVYIREDLVGFFDPGVQPIDPFDDPVGIVVLDQFNTWNTFHGVEFGTVYGRSQGRWSIELLSRIALGTTQSRVRINGSTTNTPPGTTEAGGLLAQTSNIGTYTHDAFSIAPELGMTMGYRIGPTWKFTVGYNFIYWSNVIRAGQVIDRDINTLLLPPQGQVTGPQRPRFRVDETDFWAMGLSLGLEGRW